VLKGEESQIGQRWSGMSLRSIRLEPLRRWDMALEELVVSGCKAKVQDEEASRMGRAHTRHMVLPRRLQSTEVLEVEPNRALHDCESLRLQAKAKILELQGDQKNKESTHSNTARREWNPWSLVEVTTQHFTKSSEGSVL
jgi:hypothetical protein